MASSSSPSATLPPKIRYDVFISFRGADTRSNFTSYLYSALRGKYIASFIDNNIERGKDISELFKIIEESKASVIIFSEKYANSDWCLDELLKIMECREKRDHCVLPIFYNVDPSDVQNQTGNFGKEFHILAKKFEHRAQQWKSALTAATNIAGWDRFNFSTDAEVIEVVVKEITRKFYLSPYVFCNDIVGIDTYIEQILPLLSIGSADIRTIGIWGMGGIGKTTIAEGLLSKISYKFDDHCFVGSVREKSSKNDLVQLKERLIWKLLGDKTLSIEMSGNLPSQVIEILKRKKVIIVLDDVNNQNQLDTLIGNYAWLGPGSRVILVSRDTEIFKSNEIYEVKRLGDEPALELLCLKAFKQKQPLEGYVDLANRVVNYAQGVPLALTVLGSHLCSSKSPNEWENILGKLQDSLDPDIKKILEISFDDLEPKTKEIFLDIACFFNGSRRDEVEDVLNGCDFNTKWGITCLVNKCLLTVGDNNILSMHDLILEMGRDKAQTQGSRLWIPKGICQILRNKKMPGNEVIQGLFLDISEVGNVQYLHPKAFSKMFKLRLLKIYRTWDSPGRFESAGESEHLKCLPDLLNLFHWQEYPYKSLPQNFYAEHLVELKMPNSDITHLWNGEKYLGNLKRLELYGCRKLLRLPDLSSAKKMDKIDLNGCESLAEVPSLKCLDNLTQLFLRGCKELKSVPELPRSLHILDLRYSGVEESSPVITLAKRSLIRFRFIGAADQC